MAAMLASENGVNSTTTAKILSAPRSKIKARLVTVAEFVKTRKENVSCKNAYYDSVKQLIFSPRTEYYMKKVRMPKDPFFA